VPASEYIRGIRARIGNQLLMLPGVMAVVFDDAGRVLVQRRSDNGEWDLPGGILEPGEEPAECAVREIQEETGVDVLPERIAGVHTEADIVRYPNGDLVQFLAIVMVCRAVGGQARVNDEESLEVGFFPTDALPALGEYQRSVLAMVLENDPRTRFLVNSTPGGA
jgi:8-oxo-dGTP pyrophosphatase MutT (NUDIX family)